MHGWRIHSIGCFTGCGGGYSIVVLTLDNRPWPTGSPPSRRSPRWSTATL